MPAAEQNPYICVISKKILIDTNDTLVTILQQMYTVFADLAAP